MQAIYGYKQMKNGMYRLYKSEPQAITAWRGTNDKITTVRHEHSGNIMSFDTLDELQTYCRNRFKTSAYDMKGW